MKWLLEENSLHWVSATLLLSIAFENKFDTISLESTLANWIISSKTSFKNNILPVFWFVIKSLTVSLYIS